MKYLIGYLPGKVISEQRAIESRVGTDKTKMYNETLKNKGLKVGKDPQVYYSTTTGEILNQALKGNESNFLSIFKPTNTSTNGYRDYLKIGDKVIESSPKEGDKSLELTANFEGPSLPVLASNNGLLLIWRAMIQMNEKQSPIYFTMQFGSGSSKEEMKKERQTQTVDISLESLMKVKFTIPWSDSVFSIVNDVRNVQQNRQNVENMSKLDESSLAKRIKDLVSSVIQGVTRPTGWVPEKMENEVKNLKGWKRSVEDFDYNKLASTLINLRNIPDGDEDGVVNSKTAINKGRTWIAQTQDYFEDLIEKMRNAYLNNFYVFAKKYMPVTGNQRYAEIYQYLMKQKPTPLTPFVFTSLFNKSSVVGYAKYAQSGKGVGEKEHGSGN